MNLKNFDTIRCLVTSKCIIASIQNQRIDVEKNNKNENSLRLFVI